MPDKNNVADQPAESPTAAGFAATQPVILAESKKSKKQSATYTLHPLQDKAIRYQSFMLADTSKPQSGIQIVQDAIARHLGIMQKHGDEFPPKMLAELTRLGLIK